jgi:DNA-directed RNA polymerase specialized sigma24 family protein
MEDRLHSSRSLPVEPGLAQQECRPGLPDQRATTDDSDAAARAERLASDAGLVQALAAGGFTGPGYVVFEEELANYGIASMRAMLKSGLIFVKCAQKRIKLPRWPMTPEDREELAVETVARALPIFRQRALVGGGWKPGGGANLSTYFVNFLPLQFANAYREWHRDQEGNAGRYEDIPDDIQALDPGPEPVVLQRQQIRDGLMAIQPEKARAALVLTEDGYDQQEIAEIIGDGATSRSVEGLLRRHREKIAAIREQEGDGHDASAR